MLLKAIHTVMGGETYKPGDIFLADDQAQAERLIKAGAAVPVRKKITLGLSLKNDTDNAAEGLMDEQRRQSGSDKTVINLLEK